MSKANKRPKFRFRKLLSFSWWVRLLLSFAKKETRYRISRNMLKLNYDFPPELTIKIAKTQDELEGAWSILHDAYVSEGYMDAQDSGMRITPYFALPSTSTVIALWDDEVVATISVIRDSSFGFPMEKIYDVSEYRKHGRRVAEISSLAIKKEFRGNKGALLFPLFAYTTQYCRDYFGVDYVSIAVNPAWIEFYESILGFEKLAELDVDTYDFVNGAPASGAILNLRDAYKTWAGFYNSKSKEKNFFAFAIEHSPDTYVFPQRHFKTINDPVMTSSMLDYFFNYHSDVFKNLTSKQMGQLVALYPAENFKSYFESMDFEKDISNVRHSSRFEVHCEGRLFLDQTAFTDIEVLDVNLSGFRASLGRAIRFGELLRAKISIGDFEVAEVSCWPRWAGEDHVYGFVIEESSENWDGFIDNLAKDSSPMTLHQDEVIPKDEGLKQAS